MPSDCMTFQNSGYFSKIMIDYLNQEKTLQPLYNRYPTMESFKHQIEEKQHNFNNDTRNVLVKELKAQYQQLKHA